MEPGRSITRASNRQEVIVVQTAPVTYGLAGEDKLVLMTSTFGVLSEALIETVEFGEGICISDEWHPLITDNFIIRRTHRRWMGFKADAISWIAGKSSRSGTCADQNRFES